MHPDLPLAQTDLSTLIRMLQLSKRRAERAAELKELDHEFARLHRRCSPELRWALERMLLSHLDEHGRGGRVTGITISPN